MATFPKSKMAGLAAIRRFRIVMTSFKSILVEHLVIS